MFIEKRFTPGAIERIRLLLEEADAAMIFVASRGESGLIESVKTAILAPLDGQDVSVSITRGDILVKNRTILKPDVSVKDQEMAAALAGRGVGYYLIDDLLKRVVCVMEPAGAVKKHRLNEDDCANTLDANGPLSRAATGFEPRMAQIALTKLIAKGFNEGSIVVAEGGTGVGKSYAYLVPAIKWAEKNGERVAISTATIALQEQLIHKDFPAVKKMLKSKVKAVLAKGRQNYVCLRRLREAVDEDGLFLKTEDELGLIDAWVNGGAMGDKNTLTFIPSSETWSRVNSETDTCLGSRCEHFEKCFVFKARKEAANSQIVIVNHHLLFADLGLRRREGSETLAILPAFDKLIFDEAHNLEAAATGFFAESFTPFTVNKQLSRLSRRKGGKERGVLARLGEIAPDSAENSLRRAYALFHDVQDANAELLKLSSLTFDNDFRATESISKNLSFGVIDPMAILGRALSALCETLGVITSQIDDANRVETVMAEVKNIGSRLTAISDVCVSFGDYAGNENIVYWGEKQKLSAGGHTFKFCATPLDISPIMREIVYDKYDGIVMVSATLSVNGNFTFFKKRVGLLGYNGKKVETNVFPSPFPYAERALLAIPRDAPDPGVNETIYLEYVANFLKTLCLRTKGRALALFTGYRALETVADAIGSELSDHGYCVLRQGEDTKSRLIARFEEHGAAVLFATDSFWEGVDIDNRALKVVAICRLPFSPPGAPVASARGDRVAKMGLSPFFELQEPEAAIKLKQACGRLMRKSSDYGVVVILDSRVVHKVYGPRLIAALPPAKRLVASTKEVLTGAIRFLRERDED